MGLAHDILQYAIDCEVKWNEDDLKRTLQGAVPVEAVAAAIRGCNSGMFLLAGRVPVECEFSLYSNILVVEYSTSSYWANYTVVLRPYG